VKTWIRLALISSALVWLAAPTRSQSLGNAGTVEGSVVDQSGAAIAKAELKIHNAVSGYSQTVLSGPDGAFQLVNIPPSQYHLEIKASGFSVFPQEVTIRNSLPVQIKAALAVAGSNTTVTVEGAADALETDPSAHVAVDRNLLLKIPAMDPGTGLSQAIVYSTGGVAADGNGFFHPLGDHAQVTFVIDGQPISDQQSKVFSTQLPLSAVQSMELITGNPGAEFGDKTSLIAQVTTRSGLGAGRVFGNIDASYGTFGSGTALRSEDSPRHWLPGASYAERSAPTAWWTQHGAENGRGYRSHPQGADQARPVFCGDEAPATTISSGSVWSLLQEQAGSPREFAGAHGGGKFTYRQAPRLLQCSNGGGAGLSVRCGCWRCQGADQS
jgi:hypothetical protein